VKVGSRRPPETGPFTVVPFPQGSKSIQIPDIPRSRMSWRNSSLGIEAESLDGQLADFFGVKEGVLVRAVTKASPAEKAGIKAGDVIVRIADTKVASPGDITNQLRGGNTNFVVMRDRKEVTVALPLEDDRRSGRGSRAEIDQEDRF